MSKWQEYNDKFSALTQREKVIIALSIVFLSGYLVYVLLVEPQMKKLHTSTNSLTQKEVSVETFQSQINDIKLALKQDPNVQIKEEIKQLTDKLQLVNNKLDKTLVDYVAPKQMAKELTALLSTEDDVRVVGVTILPPTKIETNAKDGETGGAIPDYYRHGFEVAVTGDYFNLMKLVQKILAQNNKFSVNNLNYHVSEHPKAEMILSLVTVSDSKNVIRL